VRTANGYRYLGGGIALVLQQLFLLLALCGGGVSAKIVLLGDGARWINRFFQERLASWPLASLILDWYHCRKKCYDLTSLICRGRKAKVELLALLTRHLWRGQVRDAIDILEEYRPQAKNVEKPDELINYLKNRQAYIPNCRKRRAQRPRRKRQRPDRGPAPETPGDALERTDQRRFGCPAHTVPHRWEGFVLAEPSSAPSGCPCCTMTIPSLWRANQ
jgi:hypothetical protein